MDGGPSNPADRLELAVQNKDRRVIIQRIAAVAALGYVAPKVVTIKEAEADRNGRRRRPPPSDHHGHGGRSGHGNHGNHGSDRGGHDD